MPKKELINLNEQIGNPWREKILTFRSPRSRTKIALGIRKVPCDPKRIDEAQKRLLLSMLINKARVPTNPTRVQSILEPS